MIPYVDKVNERSIGQSLINEQHLIGILATATYFPGAIRLIEVPKQDDPSTVDIWSGPGHTGTHYTEILSGSPTGTQFLVDYTTGVVSFSTSQDGNTVYVDYVGLGSEWAAEDVNEIQNPLSTVSTQVITYNWPSAPTVSWKLADTIVKPASISTTVTDDFTFPRDLIVSGLTVSLPVQTDGSKKLISAAIDLSGSQITGNLGVTHLNSGTGASGTTFWRGDGSWAVPADMTVPGGVSGDIQYNDGVGGFAGASGVTTDGTNLTVTGTIFTNDISGDLSLLTIETTGGNLNSSNILIHPGDVISGTFTAGDLTVRGGNGAGGGTGASLLLKGWAAAPPGAPSDATLSLGTPGTNAGNFIIQTNGAEIARFTLNGNVGIGIASPDASALLDLTSTTKGFLPPRMTTTQRTSIVSPAKGLIVYDTDLDQFMGWSGSWVVLG